MNNMAKNAGYSRADAENAMERLQKDFEKRIDVIREDLKKGPEAAESVERSLFDLKAGFEDRLGDVRESFENARDSFDDAVGKGRSAIKDRPIAAVGIAVVVGVVIGLIFGRTSKK
jgi:ElaB/YqjD/DUF883 family membrane-anchored ribosome-binding protein